MYSKISAEAMVIYQEKIDSDVEQASGRLDRMIKLRNSQRRRKGNKSKTRIIQFTLGEHGSKSPKQGSSDKVSER